MAMRQEEIAAWEHVARLNNIELQHVDVSNKTEFDELCGILNVTGVAATSRLRRFLRQRQQQRSILTHGLPELGPLSETTKFTSNPSVPTEEQHAAARLQISTFVALSDLGELPYPKTNIWNQLVGETGTLGGYSSEADVNSHVKKVIVDILESLGIREKVTIREEVEVMRNRPDFMLILVNGHPIGTIEGKQPGKDAMEHPNILGEVYDQLLHLRSIFRVNTPFTILTCYDQWRICWLNDQDSCERAGMNRIPTPVAYATPVDRKQNSEDALECMSIENKTDSPPLPETPSRAQGCAPLPVVDDSEPPRDDEELRKDDYPRTFCGTESLHWKNRELPFMLASVIQKMMLARQEGTPTVLRLANETTSAWKRAPRFVSLRFDLCISSAVKNFFLWEDIGKGADGRAFLVSGGTKNAVGVLKFFFSDAERKAKYEMQMWMAVYSQLLPVAKTLRTLQVLGNTALLMPWFQAPKRTKSELDAINVTLRDDFMKKGIRHDDVAWRNVGVYREGGRTKAVVFDMQRVHRVEQGPHDDWVTPAVDSLSKKLISE